MKREEFEILSKRIRPKLLTVAQKFTLASGVEVDDVVQDALITLWELAEQNYPMQNAEALAIKITKNICVSHYRKARLDTRTSLNDNYRPIGHIAGYNMPISLINTGDVGISNF